MGMLLDDPEVRAEDLAGLLMSAVKIVKILYIGGS
jgi:hypothetical protein